jgi:hypothetical protein
MDRTLTRFDEACERPRFKGSVRGLYRTSYWVWIPGVDPWVGRVYGEPRSTDPRKRSGKKLWTAEVWAPLPDDGSLNPQQIRDAEAEWRKRVGKVSQHGFNTRKEAGRWLVWRSLQIGVLYDERMKLEHPLVQLANCAGDV